MAGLDYHFMLFRLRKDCDLEDVEVRYREFMLGGDDIDFGLVTRSYTALKSYLEN
uniref:Uncharacterized protein n=1 Tax=Acrobeloides nanus TaxID=290746 RepID=A0A914DN79_9BILA